MDLPCDAPEQGVIVVPYERLSAEALQGIIDEFVGREGTDYGDYNYSFDDKRGQVFRQIQTGKVTVLFDPVGECCHLVLTEQLPQGSL